MKNTPSTFWNRVSLRGECWLWMGAKDKDGYGKVRYDNKHQRAHRVAYQLVKGEIPNDMLLLHSCDRPACVNPAHLSPGTQQANVADAISKGRRKTGLSDQDQKYARHLYFAESRTQRELAEFFGMSQCYMSNTINRRLECRAAT